ncbi:hypothetical protein BB776_00005 [Planococcus salinarum]|uniref:Uncharacterized protein n=1 Tax=Planococcus salinarum TaxID=622695 RepID=A0ABX3D2E0_9BACL|nr:hypothetical protein BB776_00005 [Planococcus salinarum]
MTGKLIHDEGRVEWQPRTHYGYLDQHTQLQPGRTIRETLQDAFLKLYKKEEELNEIAMKMGDADADLEALMKRWLQRRMRWMPGTFIHLTED